MIPPHEAIISSFWMDREPVSRAAFGLQGLAPIEGVSWNEADRFCREKGGRLPTEAEWELAARGPQWGNLNYTGILNGQAKPGVDLERADTPANPADWPDSPYGVRFRAAQLAEWTGDWFNEVTYRTSPLTDPAGPDFGGEKVVRVGPYRYSLPPDSRPVGVGFRCVYGGAEHRAAVAPPPAAPVPDESETARIQAREMLLGKWMRIQGADTIEFLEDGTVSLYSAVERVAYPGTYRIIDKRRIEITMKKGDPRTWEYAVTRGELTLTTPTGVNMKYKRHRGK